MCPCCPVSHIIPEPPVFCLRLRLNDWSQIRAAEVQFGHFEKKNAWIRNNLGLFHVLKFRSVPQTEGSRICRKFGLRWLSSWWIVRRDSLQMSGRRAWLHPDSGDAEPALGTPSLGGGLLISPPLEADSPDVTSTFSPARCPLPSDDDQQSENFDAHF